MPSFRERARGCVNEQEEFERGSRTPVAGLPEGPLI
jgi:hypothetical protein